MGMEAAPRPQGGLSEPAEGLWRITHERGPMTRQVREAALAEGGEATWEALLEATSGPCRERFRKPIGYFEWVESELALELHQAWITRQGEEFMAQRGIDAARQILQGPQSWILRMATPSLVIHAMPKLYRLYYRGGELRVATCEPGTALLELWATGYFPAWYREALPAWATEALRLTGAEGLRVSYLPPGTEVPHLHRYELLWPA